MGASAVHVQPLHASYIKAQQSKVAVLGLATATAAQRIAALPVNVDLVRSITGCKLGAKNSISLPQQPSF